MDAIFELLSDTTQPEFDNTSKKVINDMISTIEAKKHYFSGRYQYVSGKTGYNYLSTPIPKSWRNRIVLSSSVAQNAVQLYKNSLKFDAFTPDSDFFGATRAVLDVIGDEQLESAIMSALIGGVSFVTILPRDGRLQVDVFNGNEGTAYWSSSRKAFTRGLFVHSWDKSAGFKTPKSYIYIDSVYVALLDRNGKIVQIEEHGAHSLPFAVFTLDAMTSKNPFGRSLLTKEALGLYEEITRGKMLETYARERATINNSVLINNNTSPSAIKRSKDTLESGDLLSVYNESGTSSIAELSVPDLDKISKSIDNLEGDFYKSLGISPDGTEIVNTLRIEQIRREFGRAIVQLALAIFSYKTVITEDMTRLVVHWESKLNVTDLAALGDALIKIKQASDNSGQIIDELLKNQLSGNVREIVLDKTNRLNLEDIKNKIDLERNLLKINETPYDVFIQDELGV